MKNTYIVVAVVVVIAVVAFVFGYKKKVVAPVTTVKDNGSISIADGSYNVDMDKSTIKWSGDYVGGASEDGTVSLASGFVAVVAGELSSGEFTIDMNSIKPDSNIVLENYIKADNFLNVDKYPTASFVIRRVLPNPVVGTSTGKYIIDGRLTIRDVTESVSFPVTLSESGGRLVGDSSFAINKALWGIKSPGDKPVKDEVSIELHIEAVR